MFISEAQGFGLRWEGWTIIRGGFSKVVIRGEGPLAGVPQDRLNLAKAKRAVLREFRSVCLLVKFELSEVSRL